MAYFDKLIERIGQLYDEDAVHRKGFAIRDATPALAGSNAVSEMGELLVELELCRREALEVEFADVMAALVHMSIMLQLPLERVEELAIQKIEQRFTARA